ncbi:hypothetical protein D5086_007294, partial [Populus alba]
IFRVPFRKINHRASKICDCLCVLLPTRLLQLNGKQLSNNAFSLCHLLLTSSFSVSCFAMSISSP